MAIADLSLYKQALAGALEARRYKAASSNSAANKLWASAWRSAADAGAVPTTAANLDATTVGGLLGFDAPASGVARIAQIEGVIDQVSVFLVADRLSHIGGLSGTATTPQTFSLGPPSREATGAGVHAAVEIYNQVGTTATTFTCSYTNQAGTNLRTSPAVVIGGTTGERDTQRFIPMPLQEGDTGVRSVEGITLAASTVTTGNFGVTLYKPLLMVTPQRGSPFLWDGVLGGCGNLPDITNRCLFIVEMFSGANPANRALAIRIVNA